MNFNRFKMLYFIGYETLIGFNDIKTAAGVYFYVQRKSELKISNKVIPWEVEILNIGDAMNPSTGIFTTPVNGRYHFGFTAISSKSSQNNFVCLRVNGNNTAQSSAGSSGSNTGYSLPVYATLSLKKGDTIDMLLSGRTFEEKAPQALFFGILLEEDLVL